MKELRTKIIRPLYIHSLFLTPRIYVYSYHRFKFSHYKVEQNQNIVDFTAPSLKTTMQGNNGHVKTLESAE